jgi:hypothetical protein
MTCEETAAATPTTREGDAIDEGVFFFFATKEELYYMIAGYINILQALWITK